MKRLLLMFVMSLSVVAFGQQPEPKPVVPQSDAQKAFAKIKALEGSWTGKISVDVPMGDTLNKKPMIVTLRTTSRGNALIHEMKQEGSPDDPITMFYLEADQLMLTHYCDAGNRPRMTATLTPDANKVDFEFKDIAGNTKYGHMHNAGFTFIDADHHVEEWVFMMKDKPVHARFDLTRIK